MRSVAEVAALGVKNRHLAQETRNLFTKALERGALTRLPCEITGEVPAEGHPFDSALPLDVIWLRKKEHRQVHADVVRLGLNDPATLEDPTSAANQLEWNLRRLMAVAKIKTAQELAELAVRLGEAGEPR